ncbi:PssE/Cps14G family polysaccharide biosynthesis glycosyltransferase [uncultured Dysgonomonas sp.]|uniref:PssE/Cps14G family polysaccharide biosynthesis glycosyltransferase n=1 Tax=Dysgonomonas mossii TaxID=163665 RepID=UPI002804155C|nr:PssE/Cps14G family polysaccharide biosynthesis glycosyltransferase [uncultured Dysgonomonas sp.]
MERIVEHKNFLCRKHFRLEKTMIFVTVGTQIPFDRLIETIDEIAGTINETFIVQTLGNNYQPQHFKTVDFIEPDEFDKIMQKARLIISHAGIGSILSAIEYQKPIIIFPRLASFGEHRNDHQIATAMAINEKGYAYVAYDKKQLKELLFSKELFPLKKRTEHSSCEILRSIIDNNL